MHRLVFLLLVATSALAQTTSVPDGLYGRWAGAHIENGTPQLFELRFSPAPDGGLSTLLTLPYNGYDQFPFAFEYAPGGEFDGTLTAGLFGDRMRLTVNLAEGHLRGTVAEGDSVTARVHLQKVLNYRLPDFRSEEVRFRAGRDTLAGGLYLPERTGPHPAVVLVAGRGYGSRAEMLIWAKLFARNGVAALAFDAPGTGRSTGDNAAITGESRFDDVRGALDVLGRREDIGPVGLLGNSAAGWIVPAIAAERDDVAFVITLVGPAESLADQQGHVTTAFMRASGDAFSETEYAEAFRYQQQTVVLAQDGASWADFERINRPAREARWAEHALIPDALDNADLAYFRSRRAFTTPPWERVTVPVLAIFGENDPIVPPQDNVPLLQTALAENPDATVLVLPGADHTLARPSSWVGEGDWPERFYRPWTRSSVLFETLVEWVGERFQ